MSVNKTFVKNTNVPASDSPLWIIGDGWKVSNKTGIPYCPLKNITDDNVFRTLNGEKKKTLENREVVQFGIPLNGIDDPNDPNYEEYEVFLFLTDFNGDGNFSAFAYGDLESAENKKAEAIRFSGFAKKTVQVDSGNKVATPGAKTTTGYTKTITANPTNQATADTIKDKVMLRQDEMITFTDPQPVIFGHDTEQINALLQDGYNFLPKSLCEKNCWERSETDGEGNLTGRTELLFLMGKIINVKIPTIGSNASG